MIGRVSSIKLRGIIKIDFIGALIKPENSVINLLLIYLQLSKQIILQLVAQFNFASKQNIKIKIPDQQLAPPGACGFGATVLVAHLLVLPVLLVSRNSGIFACRYSYIGRLYNHE